MGTQNLGTQGNTQTQTQIRVWVGLGLCLNSMGILGLGTHKVQKGLWHKMTQGKVWDVLTEESREKEA